MIATSVILISAAQKLRELRAASIRNETYPVCVLSRCCIEKSRQTTVSVTAFRMELQNYLDHGRAEHDGDWYHEWSRTNSGTLSWNC